MNWRDIRPDFEAALAGWDGNLPSAPRLLFDASEIPQLRERASRIPGFADKAISEDPELIQQNCRVHVAHGCVLFRPLHSSQQGRFLAAFSLFARQQPEVWQCALVEQTDGNVVVAFEKDDRRAQVEITIGGPATLTWLSE